MSVILIWDDPPTDDPMVLIGVVEFDPDREMEDVIERFCELNPRYQKRTLRGVVQLVEDIWAGSL